MSQEKTEDNRTAEACNEEKKKSPLSDIKPKPLPIMIHTYTYHGENKSEKGTNHKRKCCKKCKWFKKVFWDGIMHLLVKENL